MADAPDPRTLLTRFSAGDVTAIDVRRALGGVTYGDLLRMLADAGLGFPKSASTGREDQLHKARMWMFPHHAD